MNNMVAFICPNDHMNNEDKSIILKLIRDGDDWKVLGTKDGEITVQRWYSVWSDNVRGSAEHALLKTCQKFNLLARKEEIEWV